MKAAIELIVKKIKKLESKKIKNKINNIDEAEIGEEIKRKLLELNRALILLMEHSKI